MPPKALQVYKDISKDVPNVPNTDIEGPYASKEALDWLQAMVQNAEKTSQDELFKLLRGKTGRKNDQTVKVINQARSWIGKAFPFLPADGASATLAKQTQYVYNRVLHRLLALGLKEQAKFYSRALTPAEEEAVVKIFLSRDDLQIGLINACVELVNYCHFTQSTAMEECFPAMTIQMGRLRNGLELWRGIEWMIKLLYPAAEDGVPGMPSDTQWYLEMMQQRVQEELAWMDGSSLLRYIVMAGPASLLGSDQAGKWKMGGSSGSLDGQLVNAFLRCLARLAMERTGRLCAALSDLQEFQDDPRAIASFTYRSGAVVETILRQHLAVLFNQHLTAFVIACIYYTGKVLNLQGIKLGKLTGLAQTLFNCHDDSTFQQLDLSKLAVDAVKASANDGWCSDDDDSNEEDDAAGDHPIVLGNMREYYTKIVLPILEGYDPAYFFGQGWDVSLNEEANKSSGHELDAAGAVLGDVYGTSATAAAAASSGAARNRPATPRPADPASDGKDKKKRKPLGSLLVNNPRMNVK